MSIVKRWPRWFAGLGCCALFLFLFGPSFSQGERPVKKGKKAPDRVKGPLKTSYDQVSPVLLGEQSFEDMFAKDKADKANVMRRQQKLLEERYDLSPRADKKITMSRGKPIPVGPATKLAEGMTWDR